MIHTTLRPSFLTAFVEALKHSLLVDVVVACAYGVAALFLGSDAASDEAGVTV